MNPLGRRTPTDFEHVEKYPLRALAAAERPSEVPAVMGVNWYTDFDSPIQIKAGGSGKTIWVIGRDADHLGSVRGGHCVCLKTPRVGDPTSWWEFYDQGEEGACVGFGSSRMMSLLNRKRYDAEWLYRRAQETDEFADTPPAEGTSVRAALGILKDEGHVRTRGGHDSAPDPEEGIAAYRWATSAEEVRKVLGVPDDGNSVPILNSWGRAYPHIVHMPLETLDRLLREDGEVGLVSDR